MAGKDLFKSALKSASRTNSSKVINKFGGFRGGGGVRYRKGQTLGGALFGVLFGILLLLGSPVVLWMAESQNTAKDFASAEQIESTVEASGYVTFQGTPVVDDPLVCGERAVNCLYYNLQNQELKTEQREYCGTPPQDARVLYETVVECDEDGNNCQQCYWIEEDVWKTITSETDYGTAKVGSYTVNFSDGALMLGLADETIMLSETERDVWSYFPVPTELRVAGDAVGNIVDGAEKTYVLSPYDYEGTLESLQMRDSMIKWALRAVTFVLLFLGFSLILGPISFLGHATRKIPLLGSLLKGGTKFLVGLVSFILAVICFVVLWLLVTVVKNIFLIIGLGLVIAAVVYILIRRKKE